jgi:hypothetical protein
MDLYSTSAVDDFFRSQGARLLDATDSVQSDELRNAKGKRYLLKVSWDKIQAVIIYLPPFFPEKPPQVFLTKADIPKETVPHVNNEGQICTLPPNSVVNPFQPVEQLQQILKTAKEVFHKQYSPAELALEVERELLAYWNPTKRRIFISDNTIDTHRVVRLVDTRRNDVFEYSVQSYHNIIESNGNIGLVIDVPRTDIVSLLNNLPTYLSQNISWTRGKHLLTSLLTTKQHVGKYLTIFLLFRCSTANGAVILSGCFKNPLAVTSTKDKILASLNKLTVASPFDRCATYDLRSKALIQRTGQSADNFSDFRIVIVGCGSVGGNVADLLTRSGIKTLLFVDPDHIEPENLGRHICVTPTIFTPKVQAVASHLSLRAKDLQLKVIMDDVRSDESLKMIQEFSPSLIISATGCTNTDLTLSEYCRQGQLTHVAFLWVEPNLAAGHVVYQPSHQETTLLDLHAADNAGRFLYIHRKIEDPQSFVMNQHACQTSFTPYSATDVAEFSAAATKRIIDLVLTPPKYLSAFCWTPSSIKSWSQPC